MNATTNAAFANAKHATHARYTAALAAPVRFTAAIALVRATVIARANVRSLTR
jgi:hypothetical protein